MKAELERQIAVACQELFGTKADIELTRPEERFGDYSTNVALRLAKQLGLNPRDVAEKLIKKLQDSLSDTVDEVSVAGPGFINLRLADQALVVGLSLKPQQSLAGQTIVAEYSDPNPFKVLHAGHLYTSVVGDSVANLLEKAGASVHRVNFGGDVGLHVAKTMWAILRELKGSNDQLLGDIKPIDRAKWLTKRYIEGKQAYEAFLDDPDSWVKPDIIILNKVIYGFWDENQEPASEVSYGYKSIVEGQELMISNKDLKDIYMRTRQWSYNYFDQFYLTIGTKFEKYYPESETAPLGLQTVREHIGPVYQESDGAIVFNGEKYGLHTRVFINSEGLPTYEAKDVGLIMRKWQDYKFDQSIVITGNDIIEYMKVVLKSIEQFMPELSRRSWHLTHGIVKLAGGTKMSSREGNILSAADVIEAATKASAQISQQNNEQTVLGAIKYAFLKNRTGGDIVYDPSDSVSLEGNSGPYLQYAHARACSILAKAGNPEELPPGVAFEPDERLLARKISEFAEVVDKSVAELMPHHVCSYLYELAQTFNRFYENNRVIGNDRQSLRVALVGSYAQTLKEGLGLLGISAPDKM